MRDPDEDEEPVRSEAAATTILQETKALKTVLPVVVALGLYQKRIIKKL